MIDTLPEMREDIDAFIYSGREKSDVDIEDVEVKSFILYDKSGLSEAQLLVSSVIMFFVLRMDGKHSLLKLREEYEQETSEQISVAELEDIVAEMDKACFLNNQRFKDLYKNLYHNFLISSKREAIAAGSVYAVAKERLHADMKGLIESALKPEMEGRIGNVMRRAPRGMIAPHMDFLRAGQCYGQIYKELQQYYAPEAVVILGTAHQKMKNRFAICDKNFLLPYTTIQYHREFTTRIIEQTVDTADFKEDIFLHRSEHSIELQTVWLDYVWPGVKIIPILVGDMDEFTAEPTKLEKDKQFQSMLNVLSELISKEKITLVASADLSHIGRRFGDERNLDMSFISETEVADRAYLQAVVAGDGFGAIECLAEHNDKYNICGVGCIYMLNALLAGVKGQLLGYYQAVDKELEQAVGCAGVIFE